MLCLSGFELYSRWVPLFATLQSGESLSIRSYFLEGGFNLIEVLYSGKATFWRVIWPLKNGLCPSKNSFGRST